jgi:hypothetical protein
MASDVLPAQHDIDIPGPEPTTAGDMNFYLQSLLDRKEKQLQQAGNLGQRVLAQQMELEERIRQLQEHVGDKADEDEVDNPEAKARYQELSETILTWDAENAQLSAAFGASSKVCYLEIFSDFCPESLCSGSRHRHRRLQSFPWRSPSTSGLRAPLRANRAAQKTQPTVLSSIPVSTPSFLLRFPLN